MPLRKLRTREHVLADLSVNHLERHVVLCGCSIQRMHSDYGYDRIMSTFDVNGEIEPGVVFVQVKATDNLPRKRTAKPYCGVLPCRSVRSGPGKRRKACRDETWTASSKGDLEAFLRC